MHIINNEGRKRAKEHRDDYSGQSARETRDKAKQEADLKRQREVLASREKISREKIKQLNEKLKQKGLTDQVRLGLMQEKILAVQQNAQSKFDLEVLRMTKPRRTVTSDIYNQPVERVEDPVMTPEEAEAFKKAQAARKPSPYPWDVKKAKAPLPNDTITTYAKRLKGLDLPEAEKIQLLKKHFPTYGEKKK